MGSGQKFQPATPDWTLLIWACFALLSLNALTFVLLAAAPHIQQDVFRHLETIVLPLLDGREGISILWRNHHPAPLLHLIQIANLKFLGFRLDYDAYLGFFFQVLTTFVLLKCVISTTTSGHRNIGALGALGAILIVFICFGFNALVQYTWPLVSLTQYLYFFGVLVFIAADKCMQNASRPRYLLLALASLAIMFANFDFGTIFLASIITPVILAYCFERRSAYLKTALAMALVWLAYRLLLLAILPAKSASAPMDIATIAEYLLVNSPRILAQFSIALSSGLLDVTLLKRQFPGAAPVLVGASLLVTLLFVATFFTFLRQKLFRVSVMPLALMLVALFFAVPTLLFRQFFIGEDIWNLAVPRYVPTFKLAIIGMLWALWLIARERIVVQGKPLRAPYRAIAVLAMGTLLFVQAAQIYTGWGSLKYTRWIKDNNALAVFLAGDTRENNIALPREIVKGNKNYHNVLAYLARNKLNVFSGNPPHNHLLEQHVESRHKFYAADNAITIGAQSGKYGNDSGEPGAIDATWEVHPHIVVIGNTGNDAAYIRVEVKSASNNVVGNSLVVEVIGDETRAIKLYKGTQNLFFALDKDAQLRIKVPAPNAIEDLEIRM